MTESILGAARGITGPAMEVLGRGTAPRAVAVRHGGIVVESTSPLDIIVVRLTFAPGDASSRRFDPGTMLVVVTRGSLTRYAAEDCDAQTFGSGVAFAENGTHDGTMIRNEGPDDAEAIVVLLAPRRPT